MSIVNKERFENNEQPFTAIRSHSSRRIYKRLADGNAGIR
jgi:hypothetical protein